LQGGLFVVIIRGQRRSQNEAEEAMPSPEKLVKIFFWCFISISSVRKQNNGRNSRTHV